MVAGENGVKAACAQVLQGNLAKDRPEVGCQRKVTVLVELLVGKTRPLAQDFAPIDRATERKENGGVSVVGTLCPVLAGGASELAHGQDNHIIHAVAQVVVQGRDPLPELAQTLGELPALVGVGVPAAHSANATSIPTSALTSCAICWSDCPNFPAGY